MLESFKAALRRRFHGGARPRGVFEHGRGGRGLKAQGSKVVAYLEKQRKRERLSTVRQCFKAALRRPVGAHAEASDGVDTERLPERSGQHCRPAGGADVG